MTLLLTDARRQLVDLTLLETQVQIRLIGRVRGFRIRTDGNGGLVLEGSATTYYAKQLAQHAVMTLTDLPIAVNDIVVS